MVLNSGFGLLREHVELTTSFEPSTGYYYSTYKYLNGYSTSDLSGFQICPTFSFVFPVVVMGLIIGRYL